MSTVYVFGHTHPDNDAILSAVVLSQLLNARGDGNLYLPYRLGDIPSESAAILDAWDIPEPALLDEVPSASVTGERQKVILVDHNEEIQSVRGLRGADIVGVVDHHRIAGFSTPAPTYFVALPWGSTCSIIYHLFGTLGIEATSAQLCLMLSAIMTDTIMLKSPTTTDHDRRIVADISRELGVDPMEFGMGIFLERADAHPSPREVVSGDVKAFEIEGRRVVICKHETINKDVVLEDVRALRIAMDDYRRENDCETLVLVVTDVVREGSQVLLCGSVSLPERALGISDAPEGAWMPGVMSRKKQIVAPILVASNR